MHGVQPVRKPARPTRLPFPFNQRWALFFWSAVFGHDTRYQPDPAHDTQWNRGAYLVQGPGHCGACHTPKTWLGGDKTSEALRGYTLQGWTAPDITSGQGALGNWSVDDVASYLKTGHNRNAAAAGLMSEVVSLSTSKITDDDIKAMAVYLKDVSGPAPEAASSPDKNVMAAGKAIYLDLCSSCHTPDGKGVPNLFPNLSEAATVSAKDPATVLRVILQGAQSVATDREPTGPAMPAFGWQLNDAQVAAVATYVRSNFGKKAPAVSETDVKNARSRLSARTD
jgi:mono/diheme cytochrome c family protein